MKKTIFYLPRFLIIAFILFLSMFAFDVFGEDMTVLEKMLGLFMHLLPSIFLTLILIFTWRRPHIAATFFFMIAILFFIMFDGYRDVMQFIIIVAPLLLVSGLYIWDFRYNGDAFKK